MATNRIERGDRVTLVLREGVTRAIVQSGRWKYGHTRVWARVRFYQKPAAGITDALMRRRVTVQIDASDEGVQWVRGWDGPDVDALRAAAALR